MNTELTRGQKAALTRKRNEAKDRERGYDVGAQLLKERLKAGAIATFVSMSEGYRLSDGKGNVSGHIIERLIRAEWAIRVNGGNTVRHSTPEEHAAIRAKEKTIRDANVARWLKHWRDMLALCKDDSELDAAIKDIHAHGGWMCLIDNFKEPTS